ncbi:hypothetical protein AOQ84DRAFT_352166 [Glonium stellatum]|uniref:Uncharacterized protein n=1 Tax=Glonium stellatum TaxID=574774 RepID=A0A8E2FA63_9PEZI|nr:hypothetical protein AOQ84DRAFT_352166 [Glonium stellatum]
MHATKLLHATSICRLTEVRCDARTALAWWPSAATQGRGAVSRQNQEHPPRLQSLTGAIAADLLHFVISGPFRDSSRSLSRCRAAGTVRAVSAASAVRERPPQRSIACSNRRDSEITCFMHAKLIAAIDFLAPPRTESHRVPFIVHHVPCRWRR